MLAIQLDPHCIHLSCLTPYLDAPILAPSPPLDGLFRPSEAADGLQQPRGRRAERQRILNRRQPGRIRVPPVVPLDRRTACRCTSRSRAAAPRLLPDGDFL